MKLKYVPVYLKISLKTQYAYGLHAQNRSHYVTHMYETHTHTHIYIFGSMKVEDVFEKIAKKT